jgi:hypothetical protein
MTLVKAVLWLAGSAMIALAVSTVGLLLVSLFSLS